jgi:spermidine synthase
MSRKEELLYKGQGRYGEFTVTRRGEVVTLWSPSDVRQTALDLTQPHVPVLEYARNLAAAFLFHPGMSRVLVMGLGGGALPAMFLSGTATTSRSDGAAIDAGGRTPISVDVVELDPLVLELAGKYFGFSESPRLKVFIDDANRFIDSSDKNYDLIIVDTFLGAAQPSWVSTKKFLTRAAGRLTGEGLIALNLMTSKTFRYGKSIDTIGEVYKNLWSLAAKTSNNTVVFAMQRTRSRFEMVLNSGKLDRGFSETFKVDALMDRIECLPGENPHDLRSQRTMKIKHE